MFQVLTYSSGFLNNKIIPKDRSLQQHRRQNQFYNKFQLFADLYTGSTDRRLSGLRKRRLNVFHWHLTDEPVLTAEGAKGNWHDPKAPAAFYTQDDIREIVASKGKTMIGWDEIADAGVSPGKAVIMWWRHDRKHQLVKALENGYRVIMTPRRHLYADFILHGSRPCSACSAPKGSTSSIRLIRHRHLNQAHPTRRTCLKTVKPKPPTVDADY